MAKISIVRALTELKRLDARIDQAIRSGVFAGAAVGRGEKLRVVNSKKSTYDVTLEIRASFQKVSDLVSNRAKLKSAIVASNAVTKVTLGGKEMTVADAIDLKATLPSMKKLAAEVATQTNRVRAAVTQQNDRLEAEINAQTQALLGADKAKQDAATLQMIDTTQRDMKEQSMIAEEFVKAQVDDLTAQIADIETELDFVLSESNALTTVEVDLS